MDLIARLLGHGRWFNEQFLEATRPLTDEQLDRTFEEGRPSCRQAAVRLVNLVETETPWLDGQPVAARLPEGATIPEAIEAHRIGWDRFEQAAHAILAGGEARQTTTYRDNYGIPQSYGGTLLFVIVQNAQRQAELRQALVRLGVDGLMEGDVQEWEHFSGMIDRWGGEYPEGFVRPWA